MEPVNSTSPAEIPTLPWLGRNGDLPAEPFTPDVELLDQLRHTQSVMMQDQLKLRFPIPDSVVLMGLPDPTGLIKEGCVAAYTHEALERGGGMEVVVYRWVTHTATKGRMMYKGRQGAGCW